MTFSANIPAYFPDGTESSAAAGHRKPAKQWVSRLTSIAAALRRPARRPTTILAMAGQDSHAHCMRRAQGLLAPDEFELHAQRVALLRSAGEADLARDCRKAWMAGTARAYRGCVQQLESRIRR